MTEVGNGLSAENASWQFGGNVPEKFLSHAQQSIPLYQLGHDLILELSDFFIKPNSVIYDLGCSTGQLLSLLCSRVSSKKNVEFFGIDSEKDMIHYAKKHHPHPLISYIHQDIRLCHFEKSNLIIAYYTLQFIAPEYRQTVIQTIYDALNWGGAFILFEKVRGADARFQDILTTLYTEFKLKNGFSAEEILGKTKSLKGILEPFSTQGNLDLLKRAGFQDIMSIMKYMCFEGFLAIK